MPVEDIGTLSLQECRLVEGYFISHLLTKGKITQCKNLNITSNIDRDCAVVSFQNLRQFFHLIVAALGHHKFSSRGPQRLRRVMMHVYLEGGKINMV
jgi:hypothetical protein